MNALARGFSSALSPPDNRPIADWAAENVQLIGGKGAYFDPAVVPAQRVVFEWVKDPDIKQICLIWPTGCGKSVMFETLICYRVAEDPCDAQFSHQTDKPAAQWVEKRVIPALEKCKATAPIMAATHRFKKRKTELVLANGCTLYFGGANMANLQDKSLPLVCGQEMHDWRPGMMSQAKARTHDRHDEKMIFVSQGAAAGSDFDQEAAQGRLYESGFTCPECGEQSRFLPSTSDPCEDFESAFVWDHKLAEAFDVDWHKLFDGLRFKTQCCGHLMEDTPGNRRMLTDSHALIDCERGGYVPGWVTHQHNAIGLHWISWSKLVREYIVARKAEAAGDQNLLAAFMTKRLARFWAERVATPTLNYAQDGYSKADYWPEVGDPPPRWELESARVMAVDVQLDHYWVTVRSYRIDPERDAESRLIYEGQIQCGDDMSGVRELQIRLGVENQNVCVDCGYEPERVAAARHRYRQEVKRSGRTVGWACWVMLKGDQESRGFPVMESQGRVERKSLRMWAEAKTTKTSEGISYNFTRFSNKLAKDKLASLIKSGRLGVPEDASRRYRKQMASEHKVEVTPGEYRWIPVRKNIANHLWDCESMSVVMASMRGLLRPPEKPRGDG